MLDEKDVQKLVDVFVTREEFNEKISDLATKEDINKVLSSIDAYAKKADAYFQEMVMMSHKVDRLEKWVSEIAKKIGMKLEY